MQSFLVVAKEKYKTSVYISNFLREKELDPIDIDLQAFENAIGIENVRNIQKRIFLKPLRGKTKAVVIQTYANITTEAQNALLKVLEEPPANTIIIITTSKKELLLPTIISRCKIIELQDNNLTLSKDENTQYLNILVSLSKDGIAYKLKLAETITKDKYQSILWLEKMAIFVRQKLVENYSDPKYLNLLRLLSQTHTIIKSTNVNQRVALENLFLSL